MAGVDAFSLHPSLRAENYRRVFAKAGRAQIGPFLSEGSADLLSRHLRERKDWRLVLNAGSKVFEMDRKAQAQLSDQQWRDFDAKVIAAARSGFQYRFESVRVSDLESERRDHATLLDAFALFMSSEPVLALLRTVTGLSKMRFADAQGTCYGPGHFLTRHDDDVEGKNRLAAYVFGLTPDWDPDWGGLLLFQDGSEVDQAISPKHNMLNIFAVPQPHSVSMVAPFSPANRYSVTGWLRSVVPAR